MQPKSWRGWKIPKGTRGPVVLFPSHRGSSWTVRGEHRQSEEENVQAQQKKGAPLGYPQEWGPCSQKIEPKLGLAVLNGTVTRAPAETV